MIKPFRPLSILKHFSSAQHYTIEADRIDLLYKQSPMSILGSMASAIVLTYLLRHFVPSPLLITWFSATIVILLLRSLLVVRYFRSAAKSKHMLQWGWWHIITLSFSGIAWGAAPVIIFPVDRIRDSVLSAVGETKPYSVSYTVFLAIDKFRNKGKSPYRFGSYTF